MSVRAISHDPAHLQQAANEPQSENWCITAIKAAAVALCAMGAIASFVLVGPIAGMLMGATAGAGLLLLFNSCCSAERHHSRSSNQDLAGRVHEPPRRWYDGFLNIFGGRRNMQGDGRNIVVGGGHMRGAPLPEANRGGPFVELPDGPHVRRGGGHMDMPRGGFHSAPPGMPGDGPHVGRGGGHMGGMPAGRPPVDGPHVGRGEGHARRGEPLVMHRDGVHVEHGGGHMGGAPRGGAPEGGRPPGGGSGGPGGPNIQVGRGRR